MRQLAAAAAACARRARCTPAWARRRAPRCAAACVSSHLLRALGLGGDGQWGSSGSERGGLCTVHLAQRVKRAKGQGNTVHAAPRPSTSSWRKQDRGARGAAAVWALRRRMKRGARARRAAGRQRAGSIGSGGRLRSFALARVACRHSNCRLAPSPTLYTGFSPASRRPLLPPLARAQTLGSSDAGQQQRRDGPWPRPGRPPCAGCVAANG